MKLSEISSYLYLFGNDLRILHLYSEGKEFLYIHKELNDFYDEVFDFYDAVAESAIAQNELIPNPSDLTVECDWETITGTSFTVEDTVDYVLMKGRLILDYIADVDKDIYPSFIYSQLDSISEWIDKEVNYKFARSF